MTWDKEKHEWTGVRDPSWLRTIYVEVEKAEELQALLAGDINVATVVERIPPDFVKRKETFLLVPGTLDAQRNCEVRKGIALRRHVDDELHIWCKYPSTPEEVSERGLPSGELLCIHGATSFIPRRVGVFKIKNVSQVQVLEEMIVVQWAVTRVN